MTLEIGFLLAVLSAMVLLFLTEPIAMEVSAFVGLVVLTVTGYIGPDEAFQGFASAAVITMLAGFFLSGALEHTGVADAMGSGIYAWVGNRELAVVALVVLVAAMLSAFMPNIAATAVLMPAVASLARKTGIAASRLFMPLAFGAILGGTTTLLGTPPNLVAAEMLVERGFEPFGLFDVTPYGLVLVALGSVVMVGLGNRLLPARSPSGPPTADELARSYRLEGRLFSIRVPDGSPLDGVTLREARLGTALRINVAAVLRGDERILAPPPDTGLRVGDVLVVQGDSEDLEELLRVRGLEMGEEGEVELRQAARVFTGVVVRVREASPLVGRTVQGLRFRERYGGLVAGIWRDGERAHDRPGGLPLEVGDELLALGDRSQVEEMASRPEVELLEIGPPALRRLEETVFEVQVTRNSPLDGVTVRDSRMGELVGLTVIGLVHPGQSLQPATPDEELREGDRLLVTGEPERVRSLLRFGEVELEEERTRETIESDEVKVVEIIIAPRSEVAGSSLRELEFRDRYGVSVLAVSRGGEPHFEGLADLRLRVGDALLLQGPVARIALLGRDPDFLLLAPELLEPRRTRRAPVALGALALMVGLVTTDAYPIHLAAFIAAVVTVLGGAQTMEQAYRAIDWRTIFLVAAILPMGLAVERSGAGLLLAEQVIGAVGGLGPEALLVALMAVSSVLSQGFGSAPAVVMLAPVVFQAAERTGIRPEPLLMGTALAASVAFLTPFSHKANLLVMSAGAYRSGDYVRLGLVLTVVCLATLALIIPLLMPF